MMRLLLHIINTLQVLPYCRPFAGGQARNPEAGPYLTKLARTHCSALRRGGGGPRELPEREGLA